MKHKKKKMVAVEVVGPLEQEVEEEERHDSEDDEMEAALKDMAPGYRVVKLYRYPGGHETGGRPRLLGGIAPEDFTDILIQQQFGGGRYYGRWKKKDGTYLRYNFEIEGEPKILTRAAEEARRVEQAREDNPYGFLKQGQQDEQQQDGDAGIGTTDILRIMAETRRESREEMRMLLELMRPAQPAPDATEKVFSLVEKIVPLISTGGGDGSGGNPWLFALSQLKEPLMKIVDTIHTAVTKPPQPTPAPGQPAPTGKRLDQPPKPEPEPTPTEPEPKSEDEMLLESFRPYLGMLVKAAAEGKDPALYADLVLDQTPVFAYDRLRTWLLKPGCLDDLAKLDQAVYHDKAWWTALRGTLLDTLNEDLGHAVRPIQPREDPDPPAGGPALSPLVS